MVREEESLLRSVFFLTDGFLPEVSQDWDQLLTNGFLHRVPGGL